MDFKEYQEKAWTTAIHPNAGDNYVYPTLGLVGEAGEIANKVKKIERDAGGEMSEEARQALGAELGDLLWYLAALATELKLNLGILAEENLAKLQDRKVRGVLQGSGDDR